MQIANFTLAPPALPFSPLQNFMANSSINSLFLTATKVSLGIKNPNAYHIILQLCWIHPKNGIFALAPSKIWIFENIYLPPIYSSLYSLTSYLIEEYLQILIYSCKFCKTHMISFIKISIRFQTYLKKISISIFEYSWDKLFQFRILKNWKIGYIHLKVTYLLNQLNSLSKGVTV